VKGAQCLPSANIAAPKFESLQSDTSDAPQQIQKVVELLGTLEDATTIGFVGHCEIAPSSACHGVAVKGLGQRIHDVAIHSSDVTGSDADGQSVGIAVSSDQKALFAALSQRNQRL